VFHCCTTMNRLFSTLLVGVALAQTAPKTCDVVGTKQANGTDIRGDSDKDYHLVALLYAW